MAWHGPDSSTCRYTSSAVPTAAHWHDAARKQARRATLGHWMCVATTMHSLHVLYTKTVPCMLTALSSTPHKTLPCSQRVTGSARGSPQHCRLLQGARQHPRAASGEASQPPPPPPLPRLTHPRCYYSLHFLGAPRPATQAAAAHHRSLRHRPLCCCTQENDDASHLPVHCTSPCPSCRPERASAALPDNTNTWPPITKLCLQAPPYTHGTDCLHQRRGSAAAHTPAAAAWTQDTAAESPPMQVAVDMHARIKLLGKPLTTHQGVGRGVSVQQTRSKGNRQRPTPQPPGGGGHKMACGACAHPGDASRRQNNTSCVILV